MAAIHQFLAGFSKGDAISNEAIVMQELFRSWGYKSEIFSESKRILPELRDSAYDISDYEPNEKDIALLHLSIGSAVNDFFAALPCKKSILYHNITPSHYFSVFEEKTERNLADGRKQAESLANTASVNMACSNFNAKELSSMGYKDVKVLPLMLDFEKFKTPPDEELMKTFDDDAINILFVGRGVPNKKIEDIIKTFHYFQKTINHHSRLILAGSFAGIENYYYTLLAQTAELDINDVFFTGLVPQPKLNAYYECADVFLCMSEHEGFCIPIIESMKMNVPVLAYDAGAVAETMDGAGILFNEKNFTLIAEMINRLVTDSAFKNNVLNKQQERVTRFQELDLGNKLKDHLQPLLSNN